MTLTDDANEVGRIIKDIERRVSDLEEASRETESPQLLRTIDDSVLVSDSVAESDQITLEALTWKGDRGWRTATWGSYDRS